MAEAAKREACVLASSVSSLLSMGSEKGTASVSRRLCFCRRLLHRLSVSLRECTEQNLR